MNIYGFAYGQYNTGTDFVSKICWGGFDSKIGSNYAWQAYNKILYTIVTFPSYTCSVRTTRYMTKFE